jgi:hypothetical protein
MGKWKIISSLDGKVPALALYGEYAPLKKRMFPNKQYARAVHHYLVKRSVRLP